MRYNQKQMQLKYVFILKLKARATVHLVYDFIIIFSKLEKIFLLTLRLDNDLCNYNSSATVFRCCQCNKKAKNREIRSFLLIRELQRASVAVRFAIAGKQNSFCSKIQIRRHNDSVNDRGTLWTSDFRFVRVPFALFWLFVNFSIGAQQTLAAYRVLCTETLYGAGAWATGTGTTIVTAACHNSCCLARTQTESTPNRWERRRLSHDFVSLVGITIILHRMRVVQFRRRRRRRRASQQQKQQQR